MIPHEQDRHMAVDVVVGHLLRYGPHAAYWEAAGSPRCEVLALASIRVVSTRYVLVTAARQAQGSIPVAALLTVRSPDAWLALVESLGTRLIVGLFTVPPTLALVPLRRPASPSPTFTAAEQEHAMHDHSPARRSPPVAHNAEAGTGSAAAHQHNASGHCMRPSSAADVTAHPWPRPPVPFLLLCLLLVAVVVPPAARLLVAVQATIAVALGPVGAMWLIGGMLLAGLLLVFAGLLRSVWEADDL